MKNRVVGESSMRKRNIGCLLFLVVTLAGNGALAQNVEREGRSLQEGEIGRVMADEQRILMNDVVYALPQVLEFNGEQRTAEQVLQKLQKGEKVRFRPSIESLNGHETVQVLVTDL